jgi:hypothetical protein
MWNRLSMSDPKSRKFVDDAFARGRRGTGRGAPERVTFGS